MSGSIPFPKIPTAQTYNEVKKPNIDSISSDKLIVRFHNYIEHRCGIQNVTSGQGSKIIKLLKTICHKTIKDITTGTNSCGCECVALNPNAKQTEYTVLFSDFWDTETMVEFKTGGPSRVFGFFLRGIEGKEPPSFNIVLITSSEHLDYKKQRRGK